MRIRAVRRRGDVLFAAVLAVALQVVVWTSPAFAGERPGNSVAALAFGSALFLRGRWPLVPLAVGVTCIAVPGLNELANSSVLAIGLIASLYSCGVSADDRVRQGGFGIGLLSIVITALTADPFSLNDTLWVTVIVAAWGAGRLIRRGRDRAGLLERRNLRLEEEQETTAARATAEERIRIARELHDVVAHALSLIVVQARGGRRMLNRDRTDEALEGFDTIEEAAQEALVEMRRLLGMLREGGDEAALAPPPGLARLPELVSQVRETGLDVDLDVRGESYELPPGIDVSAYRIVQEALTNVVRHAGTSRAQVTLVYAPEKHRDRGARGRPRRGSRIERRSRADRHP